MIALVFDDLGLDQAATKRAVALPGPLTMAFLTYAKDLPRQTAAARAAGHELLVHFPMEPTDAKADAGPKALTHGLAEAELLERLQWGLSRFDGYVGINNHMGSRFTSDTPGMTAVLRERKARGLLFLDSMTTPESVGVPVSRSLHLPYAARDVFLDHEQTRDAVRTALAALEERARRKGYAIGIGHPHEETLDVVGPWLATLRQRGFALVPVSAIVRRQQERPAAEAPRPRTG
jgi:polysaccharide deacetylase 2 family uncharacterized protein YibQ